MFSFSYTGRPLLVRTFCGSNGQTRCFRSTVLKASWNSPSGIESVVLAGRPAKNTSVSTSNFEMTKDSKLTKNDVVARTLFLSVDPYMRCRFNEDTGVEYTKPFALGRPITSAAIGEIVHVSNNVKSDLKKGDLVLEWFDAWEWRNYVGFNEEEAKSLKVIPAEMECLLPVTLTLGMVGQTGLSAYFGILGEASPQSSDTLIISGAAGAVGTTVGQLAKSRGAKVIGICGSSEKGDILTQELGFDAYVNYKSGNSLEQELSSVLGDDKATLYFDNVGGEMSDTIVSQFMAPNSQVIICGQIDMYDTDKEYPPPLGDVAAGVAKDLGIRRERYLVFNYADRFSEGKSSLAALIMVVMFFLAKDY
mmetsp:Transcript_19902/g.25815  ORF Transcript_19902/g.25815 Transcript_19902/m.25815 type:complete len:363 (+) Transcript_19902:90-1178(+)